VLICHGARALCYCLCQAMKAHGMEVLVYKPSIWTICRSKHPYMWRCMLHFIGLATAHAISSNHGITAAHQWRTKMLQQSPMIRAHNIDILARSFNKHTGNTTMC
jgi:hypothetical protein